MRILLLLPLAWTLCLQAAPAAAPPDPLSLAIRRGLDRLQQGATRYVENRQCFSCHHQALTIAAFVSARQRGFPVADDVLRRQVEFTRDTFRGKLDRVRKGQSVPGGNTMAAYALFTLEIADHAADATTDALVEYLLLRQRTDGSWPPVMSRPPSEGSRFTNAALAITGLKRYRGNRPDQQSRIDEAIRKGAEWLSKNVPVDTEDRLFQLRGLVAVGAAKERVFEAREALRKQQRADGSWAQLPDRGGDAYATGAVLAALRQAGLPAHDAALVRGRDWLLRNQTPEGAWIVATRSRPVQTFFDNGDPGGKSQFISFLATGWATLALLDAVSVEGGAR